MGGGANKCMSDNKCMSRSLKSLKSYPEVVGRVVFGGGRIDFFSKTILSILDVNCEKVVMHMT